VSATITDLIERLKGLGYSLSLDGEKVRFRYAEAVEPPEEAKALLDAVREHKAEVVAYLERAVPRPLPYLDESGDLVIPFNSDPHYHWWAGGQSVEETMREITGGKRRS
jgi:hypothetical protein